MHIRPAPHELDSKPVLPGGWNFDGFVHKGSDGKREQPEVCDKPMSRSDRRTNQTHKLRRFPIQLSSASSERQDQHGKTLNLQGQPKATGRHNRYNRRPTHPTESALKTICNQKLLEPATASILNGRMFGRKRLQSGSMKGGGMSVENVTPS